MVNYIDENYGLLYLPFNRRDNRSFRNTHPGESRRNEYRSSYRSGRDAYPANRTRDDRDPYPPPRGEYNNRVALVLTLDSLTKHPKEILAMETHLHLPAPRPMLNPLRSRNTDRVREVESLDVRQKGRGPHGMEAPQPAKVINVISVNSVKDKKQKVREMTEPWMNIPISFPVISSEDVSEEPLIVEAKVEGYLVRRVYMDEGSSVEVKAGIVRPFRYPTYISNPVLVKKGDGTWRMCIDFKKFNSACLKDYYSLPNIDCKVESVMGFRYKCFLDAYKGYHQIQMAEEDEEKMEFYTDQGTNSEAYVDNMVIKSKDEKLLLDDIAETFDNLKKINMKLNIKKCSFRVEEGKFLGYMVTSKGIRANPKKTKALADLQSTKEAEEAFQQMKKLIMDLSSLTPPWEKETLYKYLAVSTEAVSAVLLTDRKGRQCSV
ncbi:hypothetical protein Tco_0261111 [Tanacetum coccineum]